MHQTFTEMYLIVSIGQSHMESPTESFIKKFFFRWSPHSFAFELPDKNPPKQVHAISKVPHSPHHSPKQFQKTHEPRALQENFRFYDHHKQDFSLLVPTSNHKVINFSPQVRLNLSSAWQKGQNVRERLIVRQLPMKAGW